MPTWSDEKYFVHGAEDDPTKCQDPKDKRIAELEAACNRALKAADAGAGSRQWEKIEDARAILREVLSKSD